MEKCRNKLPQLLAVPLEETFEGTWPFKARYTEAPGFRMHYVDEGKGETVLALLTASQPGDTCLGTSSRPFRRGIE